MDPRLVERGKMLLVGMIYYGENKGNEIAGLWQRFNPRSAAIRNAASEEGAYGVCFNDVRTEDPNFCYLACLEVTDTYAVFTHQGSLSEIGSTYQQIYGTWLPASDYVLASPYDFEAWVPVKP